MQTTTPAHPVRPLKTVRHQAVIARVAAWEAARGMWKDRQPDPIKELARMRRGWERKLPKLKLKLPTR